MRKEEVKKVIEKLYSEDYFKLNAFKEQSSNYYFQFSVLKSKLLYVQTPLHCSFGTVNITDNWIEFNVFLPYALVDHFLEYYLPDLKTITE